MQSELEQNLRLRRALLLYDSLGARGIRLWWIRLQRKAITRILAIWGAW